jgi:hypothetical protein
VLPLVSDEAVEKVREGPRKVRKLSSQAHPPARAFRARGQARTRPDSLGNDQPVLAHQSFD